jgi:predicted Zn-dependent protease
MPMQRPLGAALPDTGGPPDLSSMTPREAADRLFNRVMTAREQGNSEEALRFAPMALQAYERVGTLDNDARYHLALIHMTQGDTKGARVQIDKLRQSVPRHLLALMLEHELAERSGNKEKAAGVNKAFLAAYDAEIAAGRPEYEDHRGTIDRFRQAAQAGTTEKK